MSDDRKRLFISIGAAVILHIAVLIFLGINQHNYEITDEFGPITVEISYDKPPVTKPPEPEAEQINSFDSEEAPPVVAEAPEPVPASEPEPQPVPAPKPETAAAAAPVSAPRTYAPAAVDNSFIKDIKQRSSTGGVDARSVFGDDPVPSSTNRPDVLSAAGAQDGSEVVSGDYQPAPARNEQAEPEEPADTSIVEAGTFSSLDSRLANADTSVDKAENDSSAVNKYVTSAAAADVSGQSKTVRFNNPALSRELKEWSHPEIPAGVQTAGISKYTVVIEFDIDSNGITSGFTIKQPSADTRIDAAVYEALRKWLFAESKSLAGKKVRATLTYVIEIK